jgi:hypothetical protein
MDNRFFGLMAMMRITMLGGVSECLVHFIRVICCISWTEVLYMFFGEVIEGDAPCSIRPKPNTHPLIRQNLLIF